MDRVFSFINNPLASVKYSLNEWNDLISQARFHTLLPFINNLLLENKVYNSTPSIIQDVLTGYVVRNEYKQTIYLWELSKIESHFKNIDFPIVLLKGMAYLKDNLGIYKSRDFADIDIFIPYPNFNKVEELLLNSGWKYKKLNKYDDQYYREWSHAPPPLINSISGIEIDLHHHISSPISDIKIDNKALMKNIVPIKGCDFYRLSDLDVILHCANHLIYHDEMQGKVKDLIHIFTMTKGYKDNLWKDLYDRSLHLKLETTFFYMVSLLKEYFNIETTAYIDNKLKVKSNFIKIFVLKQIKITLTASNPDSICFKMANTLLIARYQWTRYPLIILLKHLVVKHLFRRYISNN